jgi:hypothetical protein
MMAQLVWEGNSRVGIKILPAQSKAEKSNAIAHFLSSSE